MKTDKSRENMFEKLMVASLIVVTVLICQPIKLQAQSFGIVHSFNGADGGGASAGLILAGNTLYGTAGAGGTGNNGTVFKVNVDGTGFTVLHSFSALTPANNTPYGVNDDGASPRSRLSISGNTLYGTTFWGGTTGWGTVFKVNTDGTGFTTLHAFDGENEPSGVVVSGSNLYGATIGGGVLFAMNTDGSGFSIIGSLGDPCGCLITNGTSPSDLTLSYNTLYGVATDNGEQGNGTIFAINTDGGGFRLVHTFSALVSGTNYDGANPQGRLLLSGNTLYGITLWGGLFSCGTIFAVNTDGSNFQSLYHFPNRNFVQNAGLALVGDTLYGTETSANLASCIVFAVKTNGADSTLFPTQNVRSINGDLAVMGTMLFAATADTVSAWNFDPQPIPLQIQSSGSGVILNWSDPTFILQSAPSIIGTFSDVRDDYGTPMTNPYTNALTGSPLFFRLRSNN